VTIVWERPPRPDVVVHHGRLIGARAPLPQGASRLERRRIAALHTPAYNGKV